MIEQLFEFATNHFILVSMFFFLLFAFFVNEGKQGGAAVASSGLVNLINKEDAVVVDIRDAKDYKQGHIAGAINIPYASIDSRVKELEAHKDKPIVLVCKMGQHAGAAGRKLKAQGFENVRRLSGGMTEWNGSSLPVVKGDKEKGERDEKGDTAGKGKGKNRKKGSKNGAATNDSQNNQNSGTEHEADRDVAAGDDPDQKDAEGKDAGADKGNSGN